MTFSSKAIFTALLLLLAPAMAPAQTFHTGGAGSLGMPQLLSPQDQYQLRQHQRCGADHFQGFVGHPVATMQPYVPQAHFVAPGGHVGAFGVGPPRLTATFDAEQIITEVYCY